MQRKITKILRVVDGAIFHRTVNGQFTRNNERFFSQKVLLDQGPSYFRVYEVENDNPELLKGEKS